MKVDRRVISFSNSNSINPKKINKQTKLTKIFFLKRGSMALGGGSMAQRNEGMAPRHAKNA